MNAPLHPDENWGNVIGITGFFYRVDFGPGATYRYHDVHAGHCSCALGESCVAVQLVQIYLAQGGEPAPHPPDGYYAILPLCCPVCGATVHPEARLTSPARGLGWKCVADKGHYWQSLGRPKESACQCSAYPFAHLAGSGMCAQKCIRIPVVPKKRLPVFA